LRLAIRLAVALSILVVVGLAVTLTNVVPVRQIVAQNEQVESAEDQLAALRRENRLLEAEAEALQTPTEVERIARETLGYVDPGEVAYRIVDPEDDETEFGPGKKAATSVSEADRAWYQDVWDFVTGADLAAAAGS
jgi:cell division protein FtsB